jgi:hypothetical protein
MAKNELKQGPRKVRVKITGISPYSASKYVQVPKIGGEKPDAFDDRTWFYKASVDADGNCVIPSAAFKFAMMNAAKYSNIQVEGRGKSTYTKHFTSGLMVTQTLDLGVKRDEIARDPERYSQTYMMNSKGVRGPGSRVPRRLPYFQKWAGEIEFIVLDPIIDKKVFETVITAAGQFIGVGQYRPEVGGDCGRFRVDKIEWTEMS